MNEKATPKAHGITCSERTLTVLSGIVSIEGFTEESIIMKTADTGLSISGHGLHVDKFDAETGDLICSGRVDAIVYFELKGRKDGRRRKVF